MIKGYLKSVKGVLCVRAQRIFYTFHYDLCCKLTESNATWLCSRAMWLTGTFSRLADRLLTQEMLRYFLARVPRPVGSQKRTLREPSGTQTTLHFKRRCK